VFGSLSSGTSKPSHEQVFVPGVPAGALSGL